LEQQEIKKTKTQPETEEKDEGNTKGSG